MTEIVDGSCIIRVKPLSEECREYSKKYVSTFGYQGNNLLCSNWNAEDMQGLDYNGLYEYFYQMKYGEKFTAEKEVVGIPAEEFENVIMTYLPVTKEELKEWAVYDEQSNMFIWERLGCGNYSPTHFGLSLPEVTEVRHNEDGTIVLTIRGVFNLLFVLVKKLFVNRKLPLLNSSFVTGRYVIITFSELFCWNSHNLFFCSKFFSIFHLIKIFIKSIIIQPLHILRIPV